MNIEELAERIGARLVIAPARPAAVDGVGIDRVYAGDRMSDLLNEVTDTTLIVTNLSNSALVRLIELMDTRAVCLLNGNAPDDAILDAATAHGAALMVSPDGMFVTCGRLYEALK